MDMLKKSNLSQEVMDVLHLLYKTYHYSPKSRRELKAVAEHLSVKVRNPTRVRGTRWTPHVEKALRILLKCSSPGSTGQYAVVLEHTEHLASSSRSAEVKGRSITVAKRMRNFTFITYAHFLLDILYIVRGLSETLQSNKAILPTVMSALKTAVSQIENLSVKCLRNSSLQQFLNLVHRHQGQGHDPTEFKFQGIALKGMPGEAADSSDLTTLPGNILAAMRTTVELIVTGIRERFDNLLCSADDIQGPGASKAVACFTVLNHDTWPEHDMELLTHGEADIEYLIQWFGPLLKRCGTRDDNINYSL